MNPVVEQNVVTYAAIITARNPEMKLRPGMTANVTVETLRRENVLRVPSAALRFKPGDEVLQALSSQNSVAGANHAAAKNVNTLWRFDGGQHPVRVEAGISDGTFTEVIEGDTGDSEDGVLEVGTRVAIRLAISTAGTGNRFWRLREPASHAARTPVLTKVSLEISRHLPSG